MEEALVATQFVTAWKPFSLQASYAYEPGCCGSSSSSADLPSLSKMWALMAKNLIKMWRNKRCESKTIRVNFTTELNN